jgi:hypothetical protein
MQPRGTLIAAGLIVVLLLLATAWLVEWPPFAATREPGGPPPEDLQATSDETPAQPPGAAEREPPGLKSTAPVDLRTPPVAPKSPPTSPPKPLSPGVAPRRPAAAAPGPVELKKQFSGKEIAKALDKAVTWLRKHQARSGGWGPVLDMGAYEAFHRKRAGTHAAGPTALALYALLARNQPLKDPVVRNGFDFLWKHHQLPQTSMETAAVLLAVAATAEALVSGTRRSKPKLSGRYRAWAAKLVDHLVKKRRARGWRYNVTGRVEALQAGGPEDLVSTHLCALALFAAHRLGIKTKDVVWEEILRYTLAQQEDHTLHRPDPAVPRGFAYILGHAVSDAGKATGGTTACGIALVRMTTYVLTNGGQRPNGIRERDEVLQQSVAASLGPSYAWLDRHWSAYANPGKQPGQKVLHHHWLWAVETAQDLDPERPLTVGTHLWYREMAEQLVNRQRADGSWRVQGTWEPAAVLDTALAVLFLQRATRRIIDPR